MRPSKQKSRTFRRVFKKTPGGRKKIDYITRKPKKIVCSNCGKELMGIPRLKPAKMRKTAKTEKRPQRPYGGVLCSNCTRRRLIEATR